MPLYLYWCCSGLKVTYWGTQSPAPVAPVPGRLTPYPGTYITTCDGENKSCIVSHWQVRYKRRLLGGCCQVWGPLLTDRGWVQRPVLFCTVPCTVYSAREAGRRTGSHSGNDHISLPVPCQTSRGHNKSITISDSRHHIIYYTWMTENDCGVWLWRKKTFIQLMSN